MSEYEEVPEFNGEPSLVEERPITNHDWKIVHGRDLIRDSEEHFHIVSWGSNCIFPNPPEGFTPPPRLSRIRRWWSWRIWRMRLDLAEDLQAISRWLDRRSDDVYSLAGRLIP